MNMTLFLTIFGIVAIMFIFIIVIAIKKEKQIYQNGIETNGVVDKVEQYYDRNHNSRYRCYIKYIGDDNLEHLGLLNVRTNLPYGRKVKIKYVSGKYNEVVFVSQEIE